MRMNRVIDMTEGPITRQLIFYSVPILLGEILQQLYAVIDSSIVGNYVGTRALGAIGASEYIINLIIGFFVGMSVGFTVYIAKRFGAKDQKGLEISINTTLQESILIGFILSIGGIVLSKPILVLMNTEEELLLEAQTYLTIYFSGIWAFVLYNAIAGILRAVGDVRAPLICLLVSSTVNVILDLVFVIVFSMGVVGAAWATVISQCLATIVSYQYLKHGIEGISVKPFQYHFEKRIALTLIRLGLPTGLQKSITTFSNILVISRIIPFGDACLAGWVAYNKLDNVLTTVAQSLGSSLTTFVSQNIGARQFGRLKQGVKSGVGIGLVSMLIIEVCVILNKNTLARFFGNDPEMIRFASTFILYLTVLKFASLLLHLFAGIVRGTGRMAISTAIMLFGQVVVRQVYLIISSLFVYSPIQVALTYPVGWFVSAVLLIMIYYSVIRKEWDDC